MVKKDKALDAIVFGAMATIPGYGIYHVPKHYATSHGKLMDTLMITAYQGIVWGSVTLQGYLAFATP